MTMISLKPAFAGEKSSARAMDLAEWTATKDFFEYCSVLEVVSTESLVVLDHVTDVLLLL